MIFSDYWTRDITPKQQRLIIDYVDNDCKVYPEIAGYNNIQTAKRFLESHKGRVALQRYFEFKYDLNKHQVQHIITKIQLLRATYNPAKIIDKEGNLILDDDQDLSDLKEYAFCIDGIESKTVGFDKETGEPIKDFKIKLCNRDKAIEFISKIFRIGEEDDMDDDGEKNIFQMSDEERKREAQRLLKKAGPEYFKLITDGSNEKTNSQDKENDK